jgi:hypothetical protein
LDNYWVEKQSCEGHSEVDWEDDLDARDEAEFELNCSAVCQCPFCVVEESDSSEQSSVEGDGETLDD